MIVARNYEYSNKAEPMLLMIDNYDSFTYNVVQYLGELGADVKVFRNDEVTLKDIEAMKPSQIVISPGPCTPTQAGISTSVVGHFAGQMPILGICLGHQLLGLAVNGKTFKLKFGHRGGNQPVQNMETGKIEITCQNHGFAVDPDSLDSGQVECTHFNLNDQTLEGLRHRSLPVFSVQYHPEASPGPHDSHYLFEQFVALM